MRKLTLVTVLFVAVIFFLSKKESNIPQQDIPTDQAKLEKTISGAMEYYRSRRFNRETGQMDVKAFREAMQQADAMKVQRKRSESALNWVEVGPDNIGGRTRAMILDKDNPSTVYAGGVAGGMFKSTDGGNSWTLMEGFNDVLPVGAIVQTINGDIYVGTGEGLYGNFGDAGGGLPGNGIYKSTDGGETFEHLSTTLVDQPDPLDTWSHINRMACSRTNENIVYAATEQGIYVTMDGGNSWFQPAGTEGITADAYDVIVAKDGTVHAAIGGNHWRSDDGTNFENISLNFSSVQDGPFFGSRTQLAVSETNPNYVYAISTTYDNGIQSYRMDYIYKSVDRGDNYSIIGEYDDFTITFGQFTMNGFGQQGTYNLAIAVAPDNQNEVYIAGQFNCYRKIGNGAWNDLGGSFNGNPYIHPDMHLIVINPDDPDEVYVSTDGGIFKTTNGGSSFSHAVQGYNTTQYYSVAASTNGAVIGGTQDNGTHLMNFTSDNVVSGSLIKGGDGGYTEISKINPNFYFAASQYGNVERSANNGNNFYEFYDNNIDPTGELAGDVNQAEFVTPFALWENLSDFDNTFVVLLRREIWLTKEALNFGKIPVWFKIADRNSTGMDTPTCLVFSDDGDVLFVGTSQGEAYRITGLKDATYQYVGGNWDPDDEGIVTKDIGYFGSQTVTGITVKNDNPDHLVLTLGNYGGDEYVYQTHNALESNANDVEFESIHNGLPKMPVYDVEIDGVNPNKLYLATELGIFHSDDSGQSWEEANAGMGRIATFMLRQEPDPEDADKWVFYAATHGRGIFSTAYYEAPIIQPPVGIATTATAGFAASLYPNPVANEAALTLSNIYQKPYYLTTYDLSGKIIHQQRLAGEGGKNHTRNLDMSFLPNGQYLMNIRSDQQEQTIKFAVVR